MGSVAAHAPEAVAAVDGLAARRAEWDLGFLATVRAGGAEHLARAAVAIATAAVPACGVAPAGAVAAIRAVATATLIAGGLAAGPTRGAAARLGEATLRVEVLLGCGEDELLSTIRAGQVLVCVHENRNSSR